MLMPVLDYFIEHKPRHKAYNVVPDERVSLLDLARRVVRISGKDLPVKVGMPGMGMEYSGDNARLRAEMGDRLSFTPVEQSVRRLYGWYQEHKGELDRECLLFDK